MRTWTPNEIINLYRTKKAKTSLFRDEEKGLIPKAERISRGKTKVRVWPTNALPEIGKHYGFLPPANGSKVVSIYTPKGGVLKSTFAFNFARMLALNNINVLVIGLDVQCSITHNLKLEEEIQSLENNKESPAGLFESCTEPKKYNIKDVIRNTDLPTLSYIPESSNLNFLEQRIREKDAREYTLSKIISPLKKLYDVILFDNSPNWNFLIKNSLLAATDVISPIACDIETYRSLNQNIEMIDEFKNDLNLEWNNFILIPTKIARTKLSTQIEAEYRRDFADMITAVSIRDAVLGQESSLEQISVIECATKSALADDYYNVVSEVWEKINNPNNEANEIMEELNEMEA